MTSCKPRFASSSTARATGISSFASVSNPSPPCTSLAFSFTPFLLNSNRSKSFTLTFASPTAQSSKIIQRLTGGKSMTGFLRSPPVACRGSFHLDFHAHPRMDAALKKMFTFRKTRDLALAALKDSGLGHGDIRKAAGTFGNRGLSSIKVVYEAATELRHLGEGVRLAALVEYIKNGSFLDVEGVRFEVPAGVRSSSFFLCK